MTGVSECSQQRGNLKNNRYIFERGNPGDITTPFANQHTSYIPNHKWNKNSNILLFLLLPLNST
ncbi:hypothetical protein [Photorhabdus bodei]|uniref:hypothetical protein n=1 Tax=Photorhabdus bodei TaxID=2029681 RepID=UPI001E3EB618|nr:hypothetical protein [Photorhabdus bodei]MCC8465600.1 hypothetical protein [Photorhabdus bodei]